MRVSYQNANPASGNESTLLRFTANGTRACVLIDAGDGVDLDALLGPEEYLNAILLTHAHIDHYRTLGHNVRHNAPIYTSETTAAVLEQSLPAAQQDNDVGDVETALAAVEPIDDWTHILDGLAVRPVPAGHTPGAAGFLIRFRDDTVQSANGLPTDEQHLLVTGDFTTRPRAGFPGFTTTYPVDIDAVFLNASTTETASETLTESLEAVLERAFAGSRVVVATSSLTGVSAAVLLAHLAAQLDRSLPITVVGQTARVYDALGLDVPGVEAVEVFDQPADVLARGRVTIAGPDEPTHGSAKRLFLEIHDDPAAVFVQLATGESDLDVTVSCTTRQFAISNHPSLETIDDVIQQLAPKHVILKHTSGHTLQRLRRRYDRCFTWGADNKTTHVLYDDHAWQAPDWLGATASKQIKQKQWTARQEYSDEPHTAYSLERQPVDLEAEGIDLGAIETTFSSSVSNPYAESDAVTEADSSAVESREATTTHQACADGHTSAQPAPSRTGEPLSHQPDEVSGDDAEIRARVLGDGNGNAVLSLLEETDLQPGAVITISVADVEQE